MPETRRKRLTELLLDRIVTGVWAVGERLPPEVELAAQMQISRSTLRLVLSDLERMGLVGRKKRIGTTVIADCPSGVLRQVTSDVQL